MKTLFFLIVFFTTTACSTSKIISNSKKSDDCIFSRSEINLYCGDTRLQFSFDKTIRYEHNFREFFLSKQYSKTTLKITSEANFEHELTLDYSAASYSLDGGEKTKASFIKAIEERESSSFKMIEDENYETSNSKISQTYHLETRNYHSILISGIKIKINENIYSIPDIEQKTFSLTQYLKSLI